MLRFFLLFCLCVLFVGSALADRREFVISLAGNEIGRSTFEAKQDGSFESVSDFSILDTKVHSKLTGRIEGDALVEFDLYQATSGVEVKTSAKEGKGSIVVQGRKQEFNYTPAKIFMANLHPFATSTVIKAYDQAKADRQKIEVLYLDSATNITVQVLKRAPRLIDVDGSKQIIQTFLLRTEGADIDVFVGKSNETLGWSVPSQRFTVVAVGYEALLVDPATLYPELSQPTFAVKRLSAIKMPMRDGVELVADIAMPAEEGKYPVILVRTPYGRETQMTVEGDWYAKRGYVYIAQDVRGRNDSGGEWQPFINERKDGYDTIDWISKQPWCDGNVGMIGASYAGWVQWWAAVEKHPALKCIIPQVSPPDPFFNFPYDHGIPFLYGAVWWARIVKDKRADLAAAVKPIEPNKLYALPITKVDEEVFGQTILFLDDWWTRETASSWTSANYLDDLHKVEIPALHVSGWFDGDGIGTKLNWEKLRSLGRTNQHLIYGPWTHAFNTTSQIGDVDYGSDAILDLDSKFLRWFDQHLKGKDVLEGKLPKVKVFVTGANEWRELADWPDPRSKQVTYYFSSKGPANGLSSVGELTDKLPGPQEPDRYTYNPANTAFAVKLPENPLEETTVLKIENGKDDLLIYRTPPLDEPIEVGGPIEVDLYFSTSAVDTDFFVSLVDIDKDGTMRYVGVPGKFRAKYRNGFDKPELLKPGEIYKLTIPLWDTAHRFNKGHRMAVIVESSMFPVYARNLGTGEPIKSATRMVAAHQTVYHDSKRPSAIRFMLLSEKSH